MTDPYTMLTDDARYRMPPVGRSSSGIGWLRATVARFSDGADHRRRRAHAVALLENLDPDELARAAATLTTAALARLAAAGADREPVDLITEVARPVPVTVLGRALGVPEHDLTARVADAARAYQPDHDGGPEAELRADAAVAALIDGDPGRLDEESAARIGLLVQACEATAGLVRNGLRCGGSVAAALRDDPPVTRTRRVADGTVVPVDLSGYPFGAGPHACPGQAHAVAIASAMVDLLWPRAFFFRF